MVRGQIIEFGSGNAEVGKAEDGRQIIEFGSGNAEVGN